MLRSIRAIGKPVLIAALAGSMMPMPVEAGVWGPKRAKVPCDECVTPPLRPSVPVEPAPDQPAVPPAPGELPTPDAPTRDLSELIDEASASDTGYASAPDSVAPAMIGDIFGFGSNFFLGFIDSNNQGVSANNSTPINGGRRFKISESTSPMPRDRVFFYYNLFRGAYRTESPAGGVQPLGTDTGANTGGEGTQGTPGTPGSPGTPGQDSGGFGGPGLGAKNFDLSRFTFGFEKTFFDGLFSAELRVPFSNTLTSDLFISDTAVPGGRANELDNISVTLKTLLYQRPTWSASMGLITNIPTADDVFITQNFQARLGDSSQFSAQTLGHTVLIRNQAVHLGPFVGALFTPTNRLFIQGFAQMDIGLNTNNVVFTPINNGDVGEVQQANLPDQTLAEFDLALGYWLYRATTPDTWIQGIAPIIEVHYTTTVDNAVIAVFENNTGGSGYQGRVGNTFNRMDIVNMTLGTTTQLGPRGFVTTGAAIPLNRDANARSFLYDWEFIVQLNYRFGPLNRYNRSPIN